MINLRLENGKGWVGINELSVQNVDYPLDEEIVY